jgi:hypothetical protein
MSDSLSNSIKQFKSTWHNPYAILVMAFIIILIAFGVIMIDINRKTKPNSNKNFK